ncbi:MAG: methyltransferase domain-containing protein [Acidobacteria bacterium]|nr:methyltransferase domain-containing protein [Acidobacteriota bacterium]MCW5971550.1 methyltransferase domain-containing protein [Blastocatellales bacterium]
MSETLNQAKAQAFADQMMNMINGGFLALMTSVGHRTGLFDTLAELPPATSDRIAAASGLNERYVREWLGAMVTGRIVEYNAENENYKLPREHAAVLTRAASPNNLATTAQFLPILGAVEDRIVDCFHKGGGVPYSEFPRFHEVMVEESNQTVVAGLLTNILPLVEGIEEKLREGIDVLDVGCGRGRALQLLAEKFPKSRFTGYDFSEETIAAAQSEADKKGLGNLRFAVKDVARIGESEAYHLITAFDAIHDQAQPARVLGEIARALKPEGTFLMQDIGGSSHVDRNLDDPLAPTKYTISCMHCMTVSLAQGGAGLGTMWGRETAERMLAEAGFTSVRVRQLEHDIMNYYYLATKR